MAPLGRLTRTILAAGSFTGSCLSELDDSAALFQRGRQLQFASQDPDRTFLMNPLPEYKERDEFEHYKDPNEASAVRLGKKGKSKLAINGVNPFKGMITNINLAIDSVKDGLEASTREVVHQAVAEMKDVGEQLGEQLKQTMHDAIQTELTAASSVPVASLLEVDAEEEHKPKLEVNLTRSSAKKKKAKLEFNPFKGFIDGINQAIDDVKDGLGATTRDIVHQAVQELKSTGEELTNEIKNMEKEVMKSVGTESLSLLELEEVLEHKPKLNITSNRSKSAKTKKKVKFAKIEFNPFKDMIDGINMAIGEIKDNLEATTRDIVHDAATELQHAGEELTKGLDQTLKQSLGEMPIVTAAPSSA